MVNKCEFCGCPHAEEEVKMAVVNYAACEACLKAWLDSDCDAEALQELRQRKRVRSRHLDTEIIIARGDEDGKIIMYHGWDIYEADPKRPPGGRVATTDDVPCSYDSLEDWHARLWDEGLCVGPCTLCPHCGGKPVCVDCGFCKEHCGCARFVVATGTD